MGRAKLKFVLSAWLLCAQSWHIFDSEASKEIPLGELSLSNLQNLELIRELTHKCPSCKRHFVTKVVNKKLVDSEHGTEKIIRDVVVGTGIGAAAAVRLPVIATTTEEVPIERDTFDVTYECGHCHHTWTETITTVERG